MFKGHILKGKVNLEGKGIIHFQRKTMKQTGKLALYKFYRYMFLLYNLFCIYFIYYTLCIYLIYYIFNIFDITYTNSIHYAFNTNIYTIEKSP